LQAGGKQSRMFAKQLLRLVTSASLFTSPIQGDWGHCQIGPSIAYTCYHLNGFAKLEQGDQTGIGMMNSWVTEART